jgi:hypothetical protein
VSDNVSNSRLLSVRVGDRLICKNNINYHGKKMDSFYKVGGVYIVLEVCSKYRIIVSCESGIRERFFGERFFYFSLDDKNYGWNLWNYFDKNKFIRNKRRLKLERIFNG